MLADVKDLDLSTIPSAVPLAKKDYTDLQDGFTYPPIKEFPSIDVPDNEDINKILKDVKPITANDITECNIEGSGIFDKFALSIGNILKTQLMQGNIDKAGFADLFSKMTIGVLEQAIQFAINKDRAFAEAQTALINNVGAKVALQKLVIDYELAKLAYYASMSDLNNKQVDYVSKKLNLAKIHADFATALATWDAAVAQTKDKLPNGDEVKGTVGVNKEFVQAQIEGYRNKSKIDALNLATNIMQLRVANDVGLAIPTSFTNPVVETNMRNINKSVGLKEVADPGVK